MNFNDIKKSIELILATGEVPLIVGDSGIGKTALAKELAEDNNWSLVVIDGNLLKEGEIGGLPTIETYIVEGLDGNREERKTTVYAVHHKLRTIDEELKKGRMVLLFIDEINRCEHTVQQELMNLILNKEINGYRLDPEVRILAAMNPSGKYGADFDYQIVDMDAAQENRFVWLTMEPDHNQWIEWAIDKGLEQKVIQFIATFPEYLYKVNEETINATPRSYERISKAYRIYQEATESYPKSVFRNVVAGNVGKLIAEEFVSFIEKDIKPLISFEDVFSDDDLWSNIVLKVQEESHTRLFLAAKNILKSLEKKIHADESEPELYTPRLIQFLVAYPVDLRIGIMKDIRNHYQSLYQVAIEDESFVELYFQSYDMGRG